MSRQPQGAARGTLHSAPDQCAPEAEPDGPRAGRGRRGDCDQPGARSGAGSPRESREEVREPGTRVCFGAFGLEGLNDGGEETWACGCAGPGARWGGVKVCVLSSEEETGEPRQALVAQGGVPGLEARMEPGREPGA